MKRRHVLTLIAGFTAIGALPVNAQILNINDAINKAGSLRMLSQRMPKAYLSIGLNVAPEKSQLVMNESMARFDRQLVELSAFSPLPDIKSTYAQLEALWGQYKSALVGQIPRRENVAALIELDAKVLELANKGASQLTQASGRPLSRLVNMSGRQRMLSQRTAKFYLAKAWNAPVAQADTEMQKARTEFTAALDTLETAPEATPQIKQELELARQQWVFFELALANVNRSVRSAENVFLASENVLSIMEKVTVMYARLAG